MPLTRAIRQTLQLLSQARLIVHRQIYLPTSELLSPMQSPPRSVYIVYPCCFLNGGVGGMCDEVQ
jgi:hypothetical protein